MYADKILRRHNESVQRQYAAGDQLSPSAAGPARTPKKAVGLSIAGRAAGGGPASRLSTVRTSPYQKVAREPKREMNSEAWGHDMFDAEERRRGGRNGAAGGGPVRRIGGGAKVPDWERKLVVENLHYEVLEDDLKELFGSFGTLEKVFLKYDLSGRSEGYAEVLFTERSAAETALKSLNNRLLDEKPLRITFKEAPTSGRSFNGGSNRRENAGIFSRLGGKVNGRAGGGAHMGGDGSSDTFVIGGGRDFRRTNGRGSGGGGGGGGGGFNRGRGDKKAVTAEDLDAEMETYMKDV